MDCVSITLSSLPCQENPDRHINWRAAAVTCRRWGWSASGMASARGTSKGLGGMQPRKVMESERRKKGWFWPVSAGTGSSSLSCRVEPEVKQNNCQHTTKDSLILPLPTPTPSPHFTVQTHTNLHYTHTHTHSQTHTTFRKEINKTFISHSTFIQNELFSLLWLVSSSFSCSESSLSKPSSKISRFLQIEVKVDYKHGKKIFTLQQVFNLKPWLFEFPNTNHSCCWLVK